MVLFFISLNFLLKLEILLKPALKAISAIENSSLDFKNLQAFSIFTSVKKLIYVLLVPKIVRTMHFSAFRFSF
jgi:hypothetical protein